MQTRLTLAVICFFLIAAAASPLTAQQEVYRLAVPGKNWSLNLPSWASTEAPQLVEGDVRLFMGGRKGDKKLKLNPAMLNIRMEPAKAPGDAQAFSDLTKKKLSKKSVVVPHSVKQTLYNNTPVIRYSTETTFGYSSLMRMKVLEAYYVTEDTWITVQVSFIEFNKEDEKYFYALLDSLQIVENVSK